jgi:hypothetical protein
VRAVSSKNPPDEGSAKRVKVTYKDFYTAAACRVSTQCHGIY